MKIRLTTLQVFSLLIPILVLLVFSIGFRPEDTGTDTKNYLFFYNSVNKNFLLLWPLEYGFQAILFFFSFFSASPPVYLSSIALIDLILIFFLIRKLSSFLDNKIDGYRLFFLLATFFFLSPFFFAIMVNVLRHGTAILSLFVFYITLASRRRLYALVPLALIALGFHKAALIMIIFSPLMFLPYWLILAGTLVLGFCYLSGLTVKLIYLISALTNFDLYSKIAGYASSSSDGVHYVSGVRYDFALFTVALGTVFHVLQKYFLAVEDRPIFCELLKHYWILVLPFFFFGFGPFSDRYLLPGWLYLSILSAVFLGLLVRKYSIRIGWDFIIFLCSLLYFMIKVQVL
ncbi:EpsG family protein [Legionella cardiaca]|uniref:EpsG family protein n=1 Tax=Legionella cardiaca TaxID=1071983 RepID=A0ABY8AMF4_9GAMM|nr:EpsG family protein [Legionella cardiaca]WED41884.1 EpsG family protein [Legionella cardiaca]